jgi:ribonuclease HII
LKKKLVLFEEFENDLWKTGLQYVAGIDEAGMGALAGPVVAAAVIFKPGEVIPEVNDSKQLTPSKRNKLSEEIKEKALCYSVGIIDIELINEIDNIFEVGLEAMKKSVSGLKVKPEHLLVDGRHIPSLQIPQTKIVKGDARSFSIASASILAKVFRDNLMMEYAKEFSDYEFNKHKGYATAGHIKAIRDFGPCLIHRTSYDFLKGLCGEFSKEYFAFEQLLKNCNNLSELNGLVIKIKNNRNFLDIERSRLKKRIKSRMKYLKNRRS